MKGGVKHRPNLLIAGQTALTLLLLATAGTAIGTFLGLMKVPLGYNPKNIMQARIAMHQNNPNEWSSIQPREGRIAYIEQIRQNIASVPGVISVAVGTASTPPYSGIDFPVEIARASCTSASRASVTRPGSFPFTRWCSD